VLSLVFKNIIGSGQKFDVANFQAGFFEDFASGGGGKGFTVFEVAAGTLESSWRGVNEMGGLKLGSPGGKSGRLVVLKEYKVAHLRHGNLRARP
jgi:hypothetical protein